MNRSIVLLITCLLATAFLAGCHEPTPDGDVGDDGGAGDGDDGGDTPQDITLTVTEAPDMVAAGESFNVTVAVAADGTVTSSHFGAHWSYNSTADRDDLTPQDFDGGSPHVTTSTELGDSYTISNWTFSNEQTGVIYYRAHVQTSEGNFWGDEETLTVTASV